MMRIFFSSILSVIAFPLFSQSDSAEIVLPEFEFSNYQNFTYRQITQEYLSNENGYMLGVTADTVYLQFTRMDKPNRFRMLRSKNERKYEALKTQDTLKKMPLEIEFLPGGKVAQLMNWRAYRDVFLSSASMQARAGLITAEDFEALRTKLNEEGYVRRIVMEDINYLFLLNGDTFNTSIEYLRLKTIRSPFSGFDYYFQGNLKVEKFGMSKHTYVFKAQNEAGPAEKPLLMEEAKTYLRKTVPKGEPVSEIRNVALNSEQTYTYNNNQKRITSAIFADVVVLDLSSRGNIRNFDFWGGTEIKN